MHIFNLIMISAALGVACGEPDDGADTGAVTDGGGDAGTTDGGGAGDTGGDGIPFTEVATGSNPSVICKPLAPAGTDGCSEAGMVVLPARTTKEFVDLFESHVYLDAPKLDLDGGADVSLISYLPQCGIVHDWLQVEHVDLDGATLRVDEAHILTDGGAEVACLYNVVTIPAVDFKTIEATLTEHVP